MTLLRRFCSHWPEVRKHLQADAEVPGGRPLELRATDPCAAEVALNECRELLNTEIAGSGSLNTRGTQLAGLTGATIALVGTVAQKWLSATGGATHISLAVLIILSMITLFAAAYCAIFAVLPTSRWRGKLATSLQEDLADQATTQSVGPIELRRSMAQTYLTMAEDQRVRNQAKADDMLLSYGFLGIGITALLLAALVFVGCQASSTNHEPAQPTIQVITRPPQAR